MNQQYEGRRKAVVGRGWKEQLAEVRKRIIRDAVKGKSGDNGAKERK